MWLSRYSRTTEITYDQGSQFIGNEFRKSLIETEYSITSKPGTLINPTSNALLKHIHHIIVVLLRTCNITQSYEDEDEPWLGILSTEAFSIFSTKIGKDVIV